MRFDDTEMQRRVMARAKGCPLEEVVDALRDAAIEWCSETYCLTNGTQIISEPESTDPVTLEMDDFVVLDIIGAQIDGKSVPVVPADDERVADADAENPVIVYAGDVSGAIVVPTPEAPLAVDLLIAVTLGPAAEEVPDVVWQRHYRALTDGAIAVVREQPDRPWSNLDDAALHRAKFVDAITAAAAFYGKNRITQAQRLRVKPA